MPVPTPFLGDGSLATSDFSSAIASAFGGNPVLQCESHKLTNVVLCLDKSLLPMSCPSNLDDATCGSSFYFPAAQ